MLDYPIVQIGIVLNVLIFIIVMLKRYIPTIFEKRRVKRLEAKGQKFVKFKAKSELSPVSIVLALTCAVLILIPYAFSVFVILSIKPAEDFRDDLR